jgi:peptidoglycan/LPS O-acetylase OafA/YrhL
MSRKNYLDAVRAFAALLVVVVHTQQHFPAPNRAVELLASFGQLGVQLFFVLSAFLIFESLDRIEKKGGTLSEFFVHRFLRIAPLYYLAIALFVGIFGILFPAMGWSSHAPTAYTTENILTNVLLLHGLVPAANNSIVGGGWSVGTEVIFYALAPALFAVRNRRLALIGLAAGCLPLVYMATCTIQPILGEPSYVNDNGFLFFSIVNQLPVFICGCLLFTIRDRAFKLSAKIAGMGWIASLSAACYIWVNYFTGTLTFAFVPLLAGISGAFFIVLMSKIQAAPWIVQEFGRRAFSIYLFNFPALILIKFAAAKFGISLPFLVAVPLVATAAFMAAGITYRLVERPSIELAKRLSAMKSGHGRRAIDT